MAQKDVVVVQVVAVATQEYAVLRSICGIVMTRSSRKTLTVNGRRLREKLKIAAERADTHHDPVVRTWLKRQIEVMENAHNRK